MADPAFDGTTKLVTLNAGQRSLDVVELYSAWKRWVAQGNSQYSPAFSPVGGESIDATAGTFIPLYAFLINGWRIRPDAANHTLNVGGGVLLVSGGGDPFVNPAGSFAVRINYQSPVQAITVSTGGAAAGLTQEQATILLEVWRRLGLDSQNPLVNTEQMISAGPDLRLEVAKTETSVVTARQ